MAFMTWFLTHLLVAIAPNFEVYLADRLQIAKSVTKYDEDNPIKNNEILPNLLYLAGSKGRAGGLHGRFGYRLPCILPNSLPNIRLLQSGLPREPEPTGSRNITPPAPEMPKVSVVG